MLRVLVELGIIDYVAGRRRGAGLGPPGAERTSLERSDAYRAYLKRLRAAEARLRPAAYGAGLLNGQVRRRLSRRPA